MIKLLYILLFTISSFSLELIDTISKRAMDSYFYNQINKINNLNYYINNYIINNAKIPTKLDLVSTYTPKITNAIWPKTYLSNTEVNFEIDLNNGEIKYTNITSSTNSIISNIFKYNFAHKSDTIINTDDAVPANFYIIMPFNLELIKFSKMINKINNDGLPQTMLGTAADIPCNFLAVNKTLYAPDGSGNLSLYFCNGANYIPLAISQSKVYESTLVNNGQNQVGSIVYADINLTNVKINVYDNHKLEKRLVR